MIDLSDNEIRKLENFPTLNRCKIVVICNNRVNRISDGLATALPNLTSLVLTNNHLAEFSELHPLHRFPKLITLSLLANPVAKQPNYRLYVIHMLPKLKLLDFRRVKKSEREAAVKLFGTFKPTPVASDATLAPSKGSVLSQDDVERIKVISHFETIIF